MQDNASVIARLQGVRKRYGNTLALDGLDLQLRAGAVTALLGANGAGKTTAVGLLLGLLAADEGTAQVFGNAPGARAGRHRNTSRHDIRPCPLPGSGRIGSSCVAPPMPEAPEPAANRYAFEPTSM